MLKNIVIYLGLIVGFRGGEIVISGALGVLGILFQGVTAMPKSLEYALIGLLLAVALFFSFSIVRILLKARLGNMIFSGLIILWLASSYFFFYFDLVKHPSDLVIIFIVDVIGICLSCLNYRYKQKNATNMLVNK